MPYMDLDKQMKSFKSTLNEIPGLEFYGFCESRKLLMVRMPESSLIKFQDVLESHDYLYRVKEKAHSKVLKRTAMPKMKSIIVVQSIKH